MCLILFKYQPNEQQKLVLVANRDEYHQRETLRAGYWPHQPHIFGGIDNVANGSWLSVDTSGRLAALTNIRKPPYKDSSKQSRGHLVRDFLSQQQPAPEFIENLKQRDHEYGLFNLLLMDNTGFWCYSNDSHLAQRVSSGNHGLSNATLDTPWPKLTTSLLEFEKSFASNRLDDLQLIDTMQSQTKPKDKDLPDTGIGLEFERFLSPIFIQGEDYGTRCTTLLTINENAIKFTELSYAPTGKISDEVQQQIELNRHC